MEKNSRILVTGHTGLVGSAIIRKLKKDGYVNIITKFHYECDLCDTEMVDRLFSTTLPEYVINCAGKVGGINANNTFSGEFIYENIMMQTNIINSSLRHKIKKLLFLGSACIYPKVCPQPIKEEYLLTAPLEETNKGYAIAKIAGIIMCQLYNKQYGTNFISAMPTNVYGEGDNFNMSNSHVLPALLRKFHEAKINNKKDVVIWGTGIARREFLHVNDLADSLIFLMNNYDSGDIINIGVGTDISIKDLAEMIQDIVGFNGNIIWDNTYPDGTIERSMDITSISQAGWIPQITLKGGIKETYEWFVKNYNVIRR